MYGASDAHPYATNWLRIEELPAEHPGQSIERISADIERDYIVRGDAVVEYGLVDEVITTRGRTAITGEVGEQHPPGYRSAGQPELVTD